MLNVRQLMNAREENTVFAVPSDSSVYTALKLMAEKNIGAVMVMDGIQMVGIFSERDFARRVVNDEKCTLDSPLTDLMTRAMITVHPDQTIEECMSLMTERRIRHLPVMENGQLIGMVSIGDLIQFLLSSKEDTIEQLQSYILGTEYGKR
jgi:CBS domain-containing protein